MVKLSLPIVTDGTVKAEPRAKTSTSHPHEKTILVVDDDTLIAKTLSMVLAKNGYKILTANHGGEALELYKKHADEIDLVLTDMVMPGMDGVELTRALYEINPTVIIIASTGQAKETSQAELRALGVEVILRKPYDAKTLLATVHDAIHSDREMRKFRSLPTSKPRMP